MPEVKEIDLIEREEAIRQAMEKLEGGKGEAVIFYTALTKNNTAKAEEIDFSALYQQAHDIWHEAAKRTTDKEAAFGFIDTLVRFIEAGYPKEGAVKQVIDQLKKTGYMLDKAIEVASYGFIKITGEGKQKINYPELGEYFLQLNPCFGVGTTVDKPRWYIYNIERGVYVESIRRDFELIIQGYIERVNKALYTSAHVIEEPLKHVFRGAKRIEPAEIGGGFGTQCLNGRQDLINFRNGLLNIYTGEMEEHTPDVYSSIQIPCKWTDKPATLEDAPHFKQYIEHLTFDSETGTDHGRIRFLLQFMGVLFSNIPVSKFKKAVFLVGEGDTGKSVFLNLLSKILGEENVTATSLKDIESNRFELSRIFGKRLAFSGDETFTALRSLENFKKLTGGDVLKDERKGVDGLNNKFCGGMIIAANRLPRFGGDKGEWVYNRMVIIPCKNSVPVEKQDRALLERLAHEKETIVKLAIQELQKMLKKDSPDFDLPDDFDQLKREYMRDNSAYIEFFESCCEFRSESEPNYKDMIFQPVLFGVFNSWLSENELNIGRHDTRLFSKELEAYCKLNSRPYPKPLPRYSGKKFYPLTLTEEARKVYAVVINWHQSRETIEK